MPLSSVCTVTRSRPWSSQLNLSGSSRNAHTSDVTMTTEPPAYYSPTLARRLIGGYGYELPTLKSPKKEKKWTLGSLFRRKKRENEPLPSSSEEEAKKSGFLHRHRRNNKSDKKKKKTIAATFDHVVFHRTTNREDSGILSDPMIAPQSGSCDSLGNRKKGGRGLAKFRAEIRQMTLRDSSSSEDDDSQRSAPPTSALANKRSRAARTERYLKRHSRDGENPKDYLRLSKSDADRSPSRSPHQQLSIVSTIPPSHRKVSNSTSNPSYKPPQSINDYNKRLAGERSLSYDSNIHSNPLYMNEPRQQHGPPPPPPRDPRRFVTQYDSPRPNTCYFDSSASPRARSFNLQGRSTSEDHLMGVPRPENYNYLTDKKPRSRRPIQIQNQQKAMDFWKRKEEEIGGKQPRMFTSQTHVKTQVFLPPQQSVDEVDIERISLSPPSPFKTPEAPSPITGRFSFKVVNPGEVERVLRGSPKNQRRSFSQNQADCQRLVDKRYSSSFTGSPNLQKARVNGNFANPQTNGHLNALRNSPTNHRRSYTVTSPCSNDAEVFPHSPNNHRRSYNQRHEKPPPHQKPVTSLLPNPAKATNDRPLSSQTNNSLSDERSSLSPFKPITISPDNHRKSTNLEEALDELEAIYNSLRLDDENLLENAEKREQTIQEEKMRERELQMARGALSDSSFSYEPFDSASRKKRKSQTLERIRKDDMAFRKMNKERSRTINDPMSVLSKVSYLLASPLHNASFECSSPPPPQPRKSRTKEPDITRDDVVYRNVKYAITGSPKVVEPQPPFGIPLGPISPSSNSDYLHVKPRLSVKKPRRHPDVVSDDLAYRNLRKDTDEVHSNNNSVKKKRAVRSLSANIGSLVLDDNENECNNSLTDIADAMEIARQVLREKERRISATRRAFMSDTETMDDSRANFLNGLCDSDVAKTKHQRKTPKVRERRSKTQSVANQCASLVDLLTSLATEARETSERIDREFQEGNKREVDQKCGEIDAVSSEARNCEQKLGNVLKKVESEGKVEDLTELAVHKLLEGVDDIKGVVEGSFDELKRVVRAKEGQSAWKIVDHDQKVSDVRKLQDLKAEDHKKTRVDEVEPSKEGSVHEYEYKCPGISKTAKKLDEQSVETDEIEDSSEVNDLNHVEGVVNNELKLLEGVDTTEDSLNEDNDVAKSLQDLEVALEERDDLSSSSEEAEMTREVVAEQLGDAKPIQDVVKVVQGVAKPVKDVANPFKSIAKAEQAVAKPDQDVAKPNQELAKPHQELASPDQDIDSDHDYVNIDSDAETLEPPSKSPFEEHRNSLIATFRELATETSPEREAEGSTAKGELGALPSSSSATNPNLDSDARLLSRLESPKLVLEVTDRSSRLREQQSRPTAMFADTVDNKSRDWYQDPAVLAVACSYGVACIQMVAQSDFVTVLGLLLAILSFIAALIV